jgi:hypothetical protein
MAVLIEAVPPEEVHVWSTEDGLISITTCCLVGVCFLNFLALFFGGAIGDLLANAYRIFSVVPVNVPRTKVSFNAYFGLIDPSNSVGGRRLRSWFSGSGMGLSSGVRSSHHAVTSNPDMNSWRRTASPPPNATGTFRTIASLNRFCNSAFSLQWNVPSSSTCPSALQR